MAEKMAHSTLTAERMGQTKVMETEIPMAERMVHLNPKGPVTRAVPGKVRKIPMAAVTGLKTVTVIVMETKIRTGLLILLMGQMILTGIATELQIQKGVLILKKEQMNQMEVVMGLKTPKETEKVPLIKKVPLIS